MARGHTGKVALALAALACGCGGSGGGKAGPIIEGCSPPLGVAGGALGLYFTGTGLGVSSSPAQLPTLTIRRVRDIEGGAAAGPSATLEVQVWAEDGKEHFGVQVDTNVVPTGVYSATLVGASGVPAALADAFAILPAPGLDALDPQVLRTDGDVQVRVVGHGLAVLDGVTPGAELIWQSTEWEPDRPPGVPATTPLDAEFADCREVPFARAAVSLCRAMTVQVPAGTSGQFRVGAVLSPSVDWGGPPPSAPLVAEAGVTLVDRHAGPGELASAAGGSIDYPVQGALLVAGAGAPALTLDGVAAESASRCQATVVAGVRQCRLSSIKVPGGTSPGYRTVAATSASGLASSLRIKLAPGPTITAIEPAVVCANDLSTDLVVRGAGFIHARPYVGSVALTTPETCPSSYDGELPTCERMAVEFAGHLGPGSYELVLENATDPPVRSDPFPFTLAPGPASILQGLSPATVYGGAGRTVRVPVGGVTGAPSAAWVAQSWPPGPLQSATWTWDGSVLQLTLPRDLPEATYDVVLQDGSPCLARGGSIFVKAEAALDSRTFEESTPGTWFGWLDGSTAGVHPLEIVVGAGNPGGAVVAGTEGGATWAFVSGLSIGNADLALLRFDLREVSTGVPLGGGDVVLVASQGIELEYSLARPLPGWNHYELRLDDATGWTRRDRTAGTSRAATVDDFRGQLTGLRIRGMWSQGVNEARLDNLAIELAR